VRGGFASGSCELRYCHRDHLIPEVTAGIAGGPEVHFAVEDFAEFALHPGDPSAPTKLRHFRLARFGRVPGVRCTPPEGNEVPSRFPSGYPGLSLPGLRRPDQNAGFRRGGLMSAVGLTAVADANDFDGVVAVFAVDESPSPTRRRNTGGWKPSSCLTLPAPVFRKRSSDFSRRKVVSRSMARRSARASVDQATRLVLHFRNSPTYSNRSGPLQA
jgi:hypothetical protein